jgi:hypothetical protein
LAKLASEIQAVQDLAMPDGEGLWKVQEMLPLTLMEDARWVMAKWMLSHQREGLKEEVREARQAKDSLVKLA